MRGRRAARRASWTALPALLAALVLAAAPAEAGTGGAAAVTDEGLASAGTNLAFGPMRVAGATWYGPGLYGRQTACGRLLKPSTIGVAHRSLPCGTAVKLLYHGHLLITTVIDRGPYTRGNSFDLTNGARRALGFEGADKLRYAVAVRYARH
jgi:rare lipoprotein A